jgi:hypothetical protein
MEAAFWHDAAHLSPYHSRKFETYNLNGRVCIFLDKFSKASQTNSIEKYYLNGGVWEASNSGNFWIS